MQGVPVTKIAASDNNQTVEQVQAFYGSGKLRRCRGHLLHPAHGLRYLLDKVTEANSKKGIHQGRAMPGVGQGYGERQEH